MSDPNPRNAIEQIRLSGSVAKVVVKSFFDESTNTASYVNHDTATKRAAVVDSVPKLILRSVQVNIRGGHLPSPGQNGKRYLKLPLDVL